MSTIKSIEITSTGTLAEFFVQIKEKVLANTSFELASEDTENFILIFDTKIGDLQLKIIDSYITTSSSTKSSTIKCILLSKNLNITENSDISCNVSYSNNSNDKDTTISRTTNLLIYENDNFSTISLRHWNSNSWDFGYNVCNIGKLTTKRIDDGSTVERAFFTNRMFDLNKNNTDAWLGNSFCNITSSGVCFTNYMAVATATATSLTGKVVEYCEQLYNCTQLTSGYKYNINGKTYFAISSNTLVEE